METLFIEILDMMHGSSRSNMHILNIATRAVFGQEGFEKLPDVPVSTRHDTTRHGYGCGIRLLRNGYGRWDRKGEREREREKPGAICLRSLSLAFDLPWISARDGPLAFDLDLNSSMSTAQLLSQSNLSKMES
ncbi:hypothetical protein ACSBR2_042002 [Camellia fascicularis]